MVDFLLYIMQEIKSEDLSFTKKLLNLHLIANHYVSKDEYIDMKTMAEELIYKYEQGINIIVVQMADFYCISEGDEHYIIEFFSTFFYNHAGDKI